MQVYANEQEVFGYFGRVGLPPRVGVRYPRVREALAGDPGFQDVAEAEKDFS